MPGGRPTTYDPKYCDEIIEFLAQGKHPVQFAAKIGVSKSTLYKWATDNPEFSDSLEIAKAKSLDWWINLSQSASKGEGTGDIENTGNRRLGNAGLIKYMLAVKDKEFQENKAEDVVNKSDNVSILGAVSSDTLAAIAKDLSDKK